MRVPLLDLTAQYQSTKDAVLPALMSVIERQQFIMGPEVPALEADIARLCHTRHAIGCASGTDALLLPLMALDLKPGDEVIAPAFTFFATAGTVHNTGGTPVFVDIDPATFNVTAATIEPAITKRTRAIIVVHLFGQMAEMEKILALAARHRIPVIEDAAQAIGARRSIDGEWRLAGETGWMGSFSFFPSKNLGAYGDAGMMVCQDDALAERLKRLRLHGGAKQYFHDEVGTNSRLDTLQAAALHAKLPFLAGWSEARRQNAARYAEGLAGRVAGEDARPPTRRTSTSFTSTRSGSSAATRCRRSSRSATSAPRCTTRCRSTCSPALRTSVTSLAACRLLRLRPTRCSHSRFIPN